MSKFEIFLIVMVCAIPFISLLLVLPKKLKKKSKKDKNANKSEKTYAEVKQEEKPKEKTEDILQEDKPAHSQPSDDISNDEFKSFVNERQKNMTKPKRLELPKDFKDMTMPYMPRRRRKIEEKPKTVAEEINSLSPTLKAMIIAGVLDKKSFDN